MSKKIPIITIDGPCGVGKGSIGRALANKLNWNFLDSGSIYRALALLVIRNLINMNDIQSIVNLCKNITPIFKNERMILFGEDITEEIRREHCGLVASKISIFPQVREKLSIIHHSFCKLPGLVADGRDMGTVVFPSAKLKIFLTATIEERARRRLLQLQDQGINATLDIVKRDIAVRDNRDSKRDNAPLRADYAAVMIDTTKLNINQVLLQILSYIRNFSY